MKFNEILTDHERYILTEKVGYVIDKKGESEAVQFQLSAASKMIEDLIIELNELQKSIDKNFENCEPF